MLFTNLDFIFIFVPITVFGFYAARKFIGVQASYLWLFLASLVFYGFSYPPYILALLISYAVNFFGARQLQKTRSRALLIFLITLNLAYLGYFKYFNFFVDNFSQLTGAHLQLAKIVLPLGISFYTFQQIPYLVGAYDGEFGHIDLLKYCVVNSFFPHLVAGPIIWHREIAPQLEQGRNQPFDQNMAALGAVFFAIGLFKKVMIADNVAYLADHVFDAASSGQSLTFLDGWLGAIAYSLQIYFDFSGYSEMAVGLGLLFGLRLPINFFSPYKATSMIEFWRRWHMSMTRFFQEFVYVPLQFALARRGAPEPFRYGAILFMMLLVGVWHGAGWTWIAWGVLHGVLLCLNHLWRAACKWAGFPSEESRSVARRLIAWTITFLVVAATWVLFRAKDFDSAKHLYEAMFFAHGVVLPANAYGLLGASVSKALASMGASFAGQAIDPSITGPQILSLVVLVAFVALSPNTLQVLGYYTENRAPRAFTTAADAIANFWTGRRGYWTPNWRWAFASATLFVAALTTLLDDTTRSVFIYFNF
jgi:alginate O-acetyltransferase complex protein AlgI